MQKPIASRVLGVVWWALVVILAALILTNRIETPVAWAYAGLTTCVLLLQVFLARSWNRTPRR